MTPRPFPKVVLTSRRSSFQVPVLLRLVQKNNKLPIVTNTVITKTNSSAASARANAGSSCAIQKPAPKWASNTTDTATI